MPSAAIAIRALWLRHVPKGNLRAEKTFNKPIAQSIVVASAAIEVRRPRRCQVANYVSSKKLSCQTLTAAIATRARQPRNAPIGELRVEKAANSDGIEIQMPNGDKICIAHFLRLTRLVIPKSWVCRGRIWGILLYIRIHDKNSILCTKQQIQCKMDKT